MARDVLPPPLLRWAVVGAIFVLIAAQYTAVFRAAILPPSDARVRGERQGGAERGRGEGVGWRVARRGGRRARGGRRMAVVGRGAGGVWRRGGVQEDFKRLDCFESRKGGKEEGSSRDCTKGQGPFCTPEEPCTPCELNSSGCRKCAAGEDPSQCHFLPDLGPYCKYPVTDVTQADAEAVNIGVVDPDTGDRVRIRACQVCCVL
jgi:hypothetical protein